MRNRLIAAAAALGVIIAPGVTLAQSTVTTGVARSNMAAPTDPGLANDQQSAFRAYVEREQVPNYTIEDRVAVGTVILDIGVTIYDVPQSFGATTNRYTVVNGKTVLVEPRTRRIVQVID